MFQWAWLLLKAPGSSPGRGGRSGWLLLVQSVSVCFSGRGYFSKLLGLALVGAGGVVGYCWYEPEFRRKVEMNILFGREVLSFIDKYLPPSSKVLSK